MKINLPFGITENDNWSYFSAEDEAKAGVWPLTKNGVWHTGIHLKAKAEYSLLKPLIPGEIVASRTCKDYLDSPFNVKYSNSYILMRHYFGSKHIPFYILYSGLASEKATIENEFLEYEKNIYRPLYNRIWKLKDNVVSIEDTKLVAYYEDKNTTDTKLRGYLNRDGRYVIAKTPNGFVYRTGRKDTECYFLKKDGNKPVGLKKVEEKISYFAHGKERDFDGWIQLYYDERFKYPKVKININNLKRIEKKVGNNPKYEITYNTASDRQNSFETGSFYIITDKKVPGTEQIVRGNGEFIINKQPIKIERFTANKVEKQIQYSYKHTNSDEKYKCFEGDRLSLESIDNAGGKYQYKVSKKSASEHLKGRIHDGFIKTDSKTFSTLYTYDIQYNANKNINGLAQTSSVIIYDEPGETNNGITLCPVAIINHNQVFEVKKIHAEYYALIKIQKLDVKYQNSALINENNDSYFYGYVKINKNKIEDFINSRFKEEYISDKTVIGRPADIPEEYNGPIGIFDRNTDENYAEDKNEDFELHIELFFTNLNDFNYKKKKVKLDKSEIDDVIEIQHTSKLFKAENEVQLKNTEFYTTAKTLRYYAKITAELVPLWVQETTAVEFDIDEKKKVIKIQSQSLKVKIEKKDRTDKTKITNIYILENKSIGEYSFKKDKRNPINFEYNEKTETYTLLLGIQKNDTGYLVFSKDLQDASEKNPVELPEETVVYRGTGINLVKLDSGERVLTDTQLISYNAVSFITIDSTKYIRVNFNYTYYFIKESDLDDVHIEAKYERFQDKGDGLPESIESSKKYNVFDLPGFILLEDSNDDYICDIKEIADKTGLHVSPNTENQSISDLIYKNGDTKLYEQLNRLVIKCPSMWEEPEQLNAGFIRDVGYWSVSEGKDTEDICNYLRTLFFITKDNKAQIFANENVKEKKYYYFHPLKFLQYYTEKTIQEFNPYCGKVMVDLPGESMGGINIVMNNPGFAPAYTWGDNNYSHYVSSCNAEKRFACITGLFNENYLAVGNYLKTRYQFYHEGVDLRGDKGTAIYSFIFGEVIAKGWLSSYGNVLILNQINTKNYYLLAHLSSYGDGISIGKIISPGKVVAKVGNSGGNWSCHLHISYYHNSKITANTLDDIYRQLAESNNGRLKYLRNPLNYKGEKDKNARI